MTTSDRTQNNPLHHQAFPRANAYDPAWVLENEMGPNALWLTEFLVAAMDLRPGMCVLDLACGKALSSIFLAREFDVVVHAADRWISADENQKRIAAFDLQEKVIPLQADAKSLPYEDEIFDVIISIDAFEYFGMGPEYLPKILPLLKKGGQIGIVNAGLVKEVERLPEEWPKEFENFHSARWWRTHWQDVATVECAEDIEGGRELWKVWNAATGVKDDDWLRGKAGQNLTFNRIVARRD